MSTLQADAMSRKGAIKIYFDFMIAYDQVSVAYLETIYKPMYINWWVLESNIDWIFNNET